MKDDQVLAVGIPFVERDEIHGHRIPVGHVCVQVLAANAGARAPVSFRNDVEDDLILSVGCFYALPRKDLMPC